MLIWILMTVRLPAVQTKTVHHVIMTALTLLKGEDRGELLKDDECRDAEFDDNDEDEEELHGEPDEDERMK
jgi:hypothetical protein